MRRGAWLAALAMLFVACDGGEEELDANVVCATDDDCDDDSYCSGVERCNPGDESADAFGCVAGPAPCPEGDGCDDLSQVCIPGCVPPDRDGDGIAAIACGGADCDDDDALRFPGNSEICDADDHDEDCDPFTYGALDADEDEWNDAECCNDDSGTLRCGEDCDDADMAVHPSQGDDSCDGEDADCDGNIDEDAGIIFFRDSDGDGHGTPGEMDRACSQPAGFVTSMDDCNDAEPLAWTGATDGPTNGCDGVDNDCDGVVDPGCSCTNGTMRSCGTDVGTCTSGTQTCSGGWGDCFSAENVEAIEPAAEVCTPLAEDEDCDGSIDEGLRGDCYGDNDRDGYGSQFFNDVCLVAGACPSGQTSVGGDCDDTRSSVSPANPEICDGRDNDCEGGVDETYACERSVETDDCTVSDSLTGIARTCGVGTRTCTSSCTWGACTRTEVCNYCDDNGSAGWTEEAGMSLTSQTLDEDVFTERYGEATTGLTLINGSSTGESGAVYASTDVELGYQPLVITATVRSSTANLNQHPADGWAVVVLKPGSSHLGSSGIALGVPTSRTGYALEWRFYGSGGTTDAADELTLRALYSTTDPVIGTPSNVPSAETLDNGGNTIDIVTQRVQLTITPQVPGNSSVTRVEGRPWSSAASAYSSTVESCSGTSCPVRFYPGEMLEIGIVAASGSLRSTVTVVSVDVSAPGQCR
jgi:hypothetical protein